MLAMVLIVIVVMALSGVYLSQNIKLYILIRYCLAYVSYTVVAC